MEAALLVPLLVWVWYRAGYSIRRLTTGAGLAIATALPWIAVTVVVVGGPARMVGVLWSYAIFP